jgi:hypothetical protein
MGRTPNQGRHGALYLSMRRPVGHDESPLRNTADWQLNAEDDVAMSRPRIRGIVSVESPAALTLGRHERTENR